MDDGSLLLTVMRRPGGLLVRSDPHRLPHARNIGCACKRQSILLFYFHLFYFFNAILKSQSNHNNQARSPLFSLSLIRFMHMDNFAINLC